MLGKPELDQIEAYANAITDDIQFSQLDVMWTFLAHWQGLRHVCRTEGADPHLIANQVLVDHVACLGHGPGAHTTWPSRTCHAPFVYSRD